MTNPNDLAIPVSEHTMPSGLGGIINGEWQHKGGLTKREEFAKAALIGLLSAQPLREHPAYWEDLQRCTVDAVRIADLFIAELNKATP